MPKGRNGSVPAAIDERLSVCRREMSERGVQAYLITNHMDSFYLTGFTGEDSAVIVTPKTVHLVSDGRFDETIDDEAPWVKKWIRHGTLVDEIGKVCRKHRFERLAVQVDGMDVATHQALRKASKPTRVVKAPPITNRMRECKDGKELKAIRRAITIAQDAFKATRRTIRVGQTEQQIAARLEYEMRLRGATCPAFSTICAVGANASHPHAHSGTRKVKRGSAILIDWGATCGYYRSDLTRVLFMGKIPPKIGKLYKIVLEAQLAAIASIRPGERMCDIDDVARGIIADAGFRREFGHGLGHGLGLDVHEPPSLSWRSKKRLAEGMVVTVEPGIYVPGVGGVRIEDDVLVTSTGHRVLSDLSKDLEGAVL